MALLAGTGIFDTHMRSGVIVLRFLIVKCLLGPALLDEVKITFNLDCSVCSFSGSPTGAVFT